MRILLTGGNGFLGRHFKVALIQLGHEVHAPTRSTLELTNIKSYASLRNNFDLILHLAAHTQAGDWCLSHSGEQWLINQQINTNMLYWKHTTCPNAKFVAIGTSCSYSNDLKLTEDNYLLGEPIESLRTYAMTKRMLLEGLQAINRQYNEEFLYLIPSTLYGTSYHTDGRQMHFIFDLIAKIIAGKMNQEIVTLWGDGFQRREIVHVEDFVHNAIKLIDLNATGIFNLGAGADCSIREYAKLICSYVGYPFDSIIFDESRYVGARSKLLITEKVKSILKPYTARDLESGIKETIDWYLINGYEMQRKDMSNKH